MSKKNNKIIRKKTSSLQQIDNKEEKCIIYPSGKKIPYVIKKEKIKHVCPVRGEIEEEVEIKIFGIMNAEKDLSQEEEINNEKYKAVKKEDDFEISRDDIVASILNSVEE